MSPFIETTVRLLGDAMGPERLSGILAAAGCDAEASDLANIERALKGPVYHQLQVLMPPPQAKARIQRTITALTRLSAETEATPVAQPQVQPAPPEAPQPVPHELPQEAPAAAQPARPASAQLPALIQGLKRFNLYFEWPEVQKLRSQLQAIRDRLADGEPVAGLIREAREQLDGLESRLAGLLVEQEREVELLRLQLESLRPAGGPRLRRLETLITGLVQAQRSGTLAPAEVERAHLIANELRAKLGDGAAFPDPTAERQPAASATTDLKAALDLHEPPAPADTWPAVSLPPVQEPVGAEMDEAEAARALAAALLDSSSIDDLLGVFSFGQPAPADSPEDWAALPEEALVDSLAPVVSASPASQERVDRHLLQWIEALAAEPGVRHVALLSSDGEVLAGAIEEPSALRAAIDQEREEHGSAAVFSLDGAQGTLLVAPLGGPTLMVSVGERTLQGRLLAHVRAEAGRLAEWAAASAL